jgi:predicted trehalose synthase
MNPDDTGTAEPQALFMHARGICTAQNQEADERGPDMAGLVRKVGKAADTVQSARADPVDQPLFGRAKRPEPCEPVHRRFRAGQAPAPRSGCPCGSW